MNVKAIPFYLNASDTIKLALALNDVINNPNFSDECTIVIGQTPMNLDLYIVIRYDGIEDESIIHI